MWLMDLAAFQSDDTMEIHDLIYDALFNSDMAKKLGFKKLFIDKMLSGDKSIYDDVSEEFKAELSELSGFEYYEMVKAFRKVAESHKLTLNNGLYEAYNSFTYALIEKVRGLKILEHTSTTLHNCQ